MAQLVSSIVFGVLSTILVFLRCLVRFRHDVFGLDDGLMVAGYVSQYLFRKSSKKSAASNMAVVRYYSLVSSAFLARPPITGWVFTRMNCPMRYCLMARRQESKWSVVYLTLADIPTVCLALPDLLLRVPRLHQSVHLRNPATNRRRADAPRHRLGDPGNGHLLGAHRIHQPFCSLPAAAGHVDRRGNMRGSGYPSDPELLCIGIVAGHRPRLCRATWLHALQDPDEGGDTGIRHRCAWVGCNVRASRCVSIHSRKRC